MSYRVFALGSNGGGQLGIGHQQDAWAPMRCIFADDFVPRSMPLKIAAGGNHTLMMFLDGSVWATGTNDDGRCGLRDREEPYTEFHKVSFRTRTRGQVDCFTDIAATWEASLFVVDGKELYSCGVGQKGELGLGDGCIGVSQPRIVPGFPPTGTTITSISGGVKHVAAVVSTGEAYGWGAGRKGQVGEPRDSIGSIRRLDGQDWKGVACGNKFTALFQASGRPNATCVVLGDSQDRFGLISGAPRRVNEWTSVMAGWYAIYMLKPGGRFKAWGRNDHAQLGPREFSNHQPPLRRIAAGSEHCLAETTDGRIIAWGWGEHGNCGSPVDSRHDVSGSWNDVIEGGLIGCGCGTSFVYKALEEGET